VKSESIIYGLKSDMLRQNRSSWHLCTKVQNNVSKIEPWQRNTRYTVPWFIVAPLIDMTDYDQEALTKILQTAFYMSITIYRNFIPLI
jgi:hypothetical protein